MDDRNRIFLLETTPDGAIKTCRNLGDGTVPLGPRAFPHNLEPDDSKECCRCYRLVTNADSIHVYQRLNRGTSIPQYKILLCMPCYEEHVQLINMMKLTGANRD